MAQRFSFPGADLWAPYDPEKVLDGPPEADRERPDQASEEASTTAGDVASVAASEQPGEEA